MGTAIDSATPAAKEQRRGQLDLFRGGKGPVDSVALSREIRRACQAKLRRVWRSHYRWAHERYTFEQALKVPTIGPVMRAHARLDKLVREMMAQ